MTTANAPRSAPKSRIFLDLRKKLGVSQAEMGRRVGKSQDYWSRLERGKKKVTFEDLERIAPVVGVKATTLARQLAQAE